MNTLYLPEGYKQTKEIDLQKNKKLALIVNLGALVITIPLILLGIWIRPLDFSALFERPVSYMLGALLTAVLSVAYIFLHELVHGVFIKHYCKEKAEYGFTGLYAFAGKKDAYFDKRSYLVIALSPVVIWGLVLLAANILLPQVFWPIYFVQIVNLSGAAGDLYVTALLCRMHGDVLVNDDGVSMRFYQK